MIAKIKRIRNYLIILISSIAIFLAVILFFRWVGWKGLLGFAVGGLAMGYVMMSENPFISLYREYYLK